MNKNIYAKVLMIVVIMLWSGFSWAANWYVDPSGTDDLTHGTGTGTNAFQTIQYAIDFAGVVDGDVINVAAGTYAESITVNKDITITGAGSSTIIDPAVDANGFTITHDGVTIQDLRITLATSGGASHMAIAVQGANSVTIHGNVIETTGNSGLGIWIGGVFGGYSNSNTLTISDNTITITNISTGIYADGGSTAQTGWSITGNTITANNGCPLELYDVTNSTVNNNTLTNATGGSNTNVMWVSELDDLHNLVFTNNIISGSGGSQVFIGTDFQTDPGSLDPGNAFTGSIATVNITGNTFSYWGTRALRLGAFSGSGTVTGITINTNTFNMTTNTEVIGGTATDKTGTGNTFNVTSPAEIQDAISSAFSGDDINVAAGTYTEDLSIPSGKTGLDIVGAGATSIIQGVDRVASASFPLADPNIDIEGSGTKIHGFTIKNPAWLNGFYSSGMVIDATNVEIYNNAFQVAGSDDGDDVSQGLQTTLNDFSGLNIHDNTFTHVSTSVAGYEGIYINHNSGSGTVTIHGNTFTGDILRAITTEASNTTISDNSIITELAPAFPGGWEGINICYALGSGTVSDVTVSGNTVKGLTGADGFQYGLVVGNGANTNTFTGIVVTENYFQGNEVGVRVREDAGEVEIQNNSLTSNSLFCVKDDDPGVANIPASCNWWGTNVQSTVAGKVSGSVTYTPYLDNGIDFESGTPGFQPSALCFASCAIPPATNIDITPGAGWTVTGTQTITTDDCHIYTVHITNTKVYTFATGCSNSTASTNFDTFLELYNGTSPYASIMSSDDACGQGGASVITWTATYTGVAYLKVRGWNSGSVGNYILAYTNGETAVVSCPTLPVYTSGYDITPVSGWTATASRSITTDACHIYKVNISNLGHVYTFATGCSNSTSTSNFDTWLELYNGTTPYASIMASDDACGPGGASVITWTADQAVVYLKVRGWNSGSVGNYTLAYKEGDVTCPTLPDFSYEITPGIGWTATASRSITTDACHIYKVNVINTKVYTFATGCSNGTATSNFDTWLELYNGTSPYTSIMSSDDACGQGGASVITWTATYSGVAYLKVRGWNSGSVGNYILTYTNGEGATVSCPTLPVYSYEITPGTSWVATGSRSITTDACHIYKVNITDIGHAYTFATGCGNSTSTSNFDTWLELYDGTTPYASIMSSDDACGPGGASVITWTADQSVVYLKVRGWNSGSVGNYSLAYKDVGTPVVTCPTLPDFSYEITPGSGWTATESRSITTDACHIYKVNITNTKVYTFATGCSNGTATSNFDTFLELYNGTTPYTSIMSSDDACGQGGASVITWTATYSGVAYLKVRGWNSGSVGNYILTYTNGEGATVSCPTLPVYTTGYDITPVSAWNATASRSITTNACHIYKVTVTDIGRAYTFATGCSNSTSTSNFDTYLELYNGTTPYASIMASDDACGPGGASVITWTADQAVVYLKVRGWSSSSVGDYILAYKYSTGKGALSIDEPQSIDSRVKIYPNPANQAFIVETQKPLLFTQIYLNDFTGRVVKSWDMDEPASSFQIQSGDFAVGVYVLSIRTSEGLVRKKVSLIR